jgi:cysteinyl-tRNA synthetase
MDDEKLKLLMDSYREQIQLNTKLLERQEGFLNSLDRSTRQLIEAINAQTTGLQTSITLGVTELSKQMTQDHGAISLKVYVALGGMISILATLISLWVIK